MVLRCWQVAGMGGELNSKLLCWGCWSCTHLCSVGKTPSKLPSIPNALFNHFKLEQKREKKEQRKKRKRKQKKRTSDDSCWLLTLQGYRSLSPLSRCGLFKVNLKSKFLFLYFSECICIETLPPLFLSPIRECLIMLSRFSCTLFHG